MTPFDISAMARECLEMTDKLVGAYGPRLAGSEPSRRVALALADELMGFCDSVQVDEFYAHPAAFYSYTKILPLVYLAGLLCVLSLPSLSIVLLIGLVASIVLMSLQFRFYSHVCDGFFPKKTCLNVSGVVEPTGIAECELIISGHHDSAPIARILSSPFERFLVVAMLAPILFFYIEVVVLASLAFGIVVHLPSLLVVSLVVGVPFVVVFFFLVDFKNGSPGAGDNLISSVIASRVAREISLKKRQLLHRTRLRVISFDAEEAGLRGASAYMRAHRNEFTALPTFMLNFDSLYEYADLRVIIKDLNGMVELSTEAANEVLNILIREGFAARLFAIPFGGGGTDAAEAAKVGIKATSIIAIPTGIVRKGLVYHTRRDTVQAIERRVVEACLVAAAHFVASLDEKGRFRN